ncbi:MAG TPA: hypothetical protein VH678_04655 [Xanthobacteraceae bacterium]|jgi:hypothetical protein
MKTSRAFALGLLGVALLVSAAASAEEMPEHTRSLPSGDDQPHVFNYGDRDSTCIRWTDKCRTCNRSDNASVVCSNIGIACQPTEPECLERPQSGDKKE